MAYRYDLSVYLDPDGDMAAAQPALLSLIEESYKGGICL